MNLSLLQGKHQSDFLKHSAIETFVGQPGLGGFGH
jgi:hypothetical protein